jgi:hypothetical protein
MVVVVDNNNLTALCCLLQLCGALYVLFLYLGTYTMIKQMILRMGIGSKVPGSAPPWDFTTIEVFYSIIYEMKEKIKKSKTTFPIITKF